ncbi:MAG: hypothetical protein LBJ00_13940 [Planctomycetaceae bacterium]|jgi:hypothetical protein|nr:hypothetical protein [Planctomycetaceae bacterium]
MKAKSKKKKTFDVKQFLILHGEKLVVGLLVLVAFFFIYLGVTSYKPLSWQPAKLDTVSQDTRNFIDANTRTATDEAIAVFHYDKYAEWIKFGVQLKLYETPTVWLPLLFPERIKRDKVPLKPVENLQASAGLGAVSIKPIGGKTRRGERWAIVTGLIPIQEQRDLYVRAYAASVRPMPNQDTPIYVSYILERAEIEPEQDENNIKWVEINAYDEIDRRMREWNGLGSEPVDPFYLAPYENRGPKSLWMACPLPPTIRPLEKGITQSSIPLLSETEAEWQKKSQEYNKKLQEEMENRSKDAGSFLDASPFDAVSTTNMPVGRIDTPNTTNIPIEGQRIVSHFLFRYLDYSVMPGKTYRYRVKLWLANPNYGLNESDVVDFSLASDKYLTSEVSKTSNKVTIPPDSRILSRSVLPPSRSAPWSEPSANILAIYFDMADGSEWVWGAGERVYRGSTLNIKNAVTQDPSALDKAEVTNPRTPPRSMPTPAGTTDPKLQPQRRDVITNACIMDIYGGVVLGNVLGSDPPPTRTPGKILVLNGLGEITIHDLIEDNEEINLLTAPQTDNLRNNPNYPRM